MKYINILLLMATLCISELPGMTPTPQEAQIMLTSQDNAKSPWFILGVFLGMAITL